MSHVQDTYIRYVPKAPVDDTYPFAYNFVLVDTIEKLKETLKNVETIGVEPKNSPLLTEGKTGPHKIQGIGANFIPNNLLTQYVDRFIDVGDDEAYEGSRILASKEGIFAGISSGAALMAAMSLDKEFYKGKNIVIILPDNGERYLSVEGLYEQ